MGRLFMDALDDPFARLDAILAQYPLGRDGAAIVVDFHAEATSEKMALGHFADGRVSAVFGTHTHVPTADAQILPGGTAYQSDAGMCGDYDSVIGMQKAPSVRRFVTQDAGREAAGRRGRGDAVRRLGRDRRLQRARPADRAGANRRVGFAGACRGPYAAAADHLKSAGDHGIPAGPGRPNPAILGC